MKHETETRRLIARLMAGSINPDEQRRLKSLLSAADLDEEFIVYREMMRWMDKPLTAPSDEEFEEIQKNAEGSELSMRPERRRHWTLGRVAAAIAFMVCLGALAGAITYRMAGGLWKENQSVSSATEKELSASRSPLAAGDAVDGESAKGQEEARLAEDITFDNKTLAEIASRMTEIFGCKIEFADKESEALRLYFSISRGSTLTDFVRIIDQYDALEASLQNDTITIKRQEAEQ